MSDQSDTPERPHLAYIPALDGLRAIAVMAVLAYHGGVSWMVGGYLGVDLFFVLSGFLITSLLLGEWRQHGRINLREFWQRRVRRLLPALALVLVGVIAYAAVVANRSELSRIRGDGFATLAYVANWRFVFSGQSYFDAFATPSPLRHVWSLAIEEQFYLLWPLLLVGLLSLRRLRVERLWTIIVAGAAGSAVLMWALYRPGHDPSRVYYGTDTRAQALLVGAALAAAMPQLRKILSPVGSVLGVVGAGIVGWMMVTARDTAGWMYTFGYLLVGVAAAAVIFAAVAPGPIARVLSPRPLRWVGMISYGVYLWHWPLFLVITEQRTGLDGGALFGARVAATFVIATASFYLVERPIRRGALVRSWRRLALIPVTAVVLVVALIFVTDRGPVRLISTEAASAAVRGQVRTGAPDVALSTTHLPRRIMVAGDSVAETLAIGMQHASADHGIQVFNQGRLGCGLAQRAEAHRAGEWNRMDQSCDAWPEQWVNASIRWRPEMTLILFAVWPLLDIRVEGRELPLGSPANDKYQLSELDYGVRLLEAEGSQVVLLTSPYNQGSPPPGVNWEENEHARTDHFNELLRRYHEEHPNVGLIDFNAFLSPDGTYQNEMFGLELRDDGVHFTQNAGVLSFEWLLPQLPRLPGP